MSQSHLLKVKRFWPLFWTQFFGAFNDNFLKNALVSMITFKATTVLGLSPAQMVAASGGIFILPFFLFSATAGQLADKFEKSKIVRIIKLAEIGIMLLASYGFIFGQAGFLMAVLFLMGLHSTFFGPIKYSILPQHLREEELVGGNALVEAGTFLSILIGTIAGGSLISIPDLGAPLVSVGLLAVAFLGYFTSRSIPIAKAVEPSLIVNWNPITPSLEILKFTQKNRPVFLSVLGISWFWFFGAAVLSLFPTYCKDVLGGGQSLVTLFLACFSIGIGGGSLLCEKMSRQHLELGLVPLGSIGITLFSLDLFLVGTPTLVTSQAPIGLLEFLSQGPGIRILADLLLLSIFSGFFIVPLYTLIQERSEVSHRSRIIAGNNILNALFMVVSSVLLLLMMKWGMSIPQMFLVLAILNGLVAAYIYTVLPEFLFRFIAWAIANLMYRLKIEGEENLPKQGPVLLVCNHVSFVDWLIVSAAIQQPIRFVMYYKFAKGWLVRKFMSDAKVILIAGVKEDPAIMENAFVQIDRDLRDGEWVGIFPEGGLTPDGKLAIFRPGVERILKTRTVPVIPLALDGMWGSLFSRKDGPALAKLPRRFWSRVTLKIGPALPAQSATPEHLRTVIAGMLGER